MSETTTYGSSIPKIIILDLNRKSDITSEGDGVIAVKLPLLVGVGSLSGTLPQLQSSTSGGVTVSEIDTHVTKDPDLGGWAEDNGSISSGGGTSLGEYELLIVGGGITTCCDRDGCSIFVIRCGNANGGSSWMKKRNVRIEGSAHVVNFTDVEGQRR